MIVGDPRDDVITSRVCISVIVIRLCVSSNFRHLVQGKKFRLRRLNTKLVALAGRAVSCCTVLRRGVSESNVLFLAVLHCVSLLCLAVLCCGRAVQ